MPFSLEVGTALDPAAAEALRLRRRHGTEAEAWCRDMLRALPRGDQRRQQVSAVYSRLRDTPAETKVSRQTQALGDLAVAAIGVGLAGAVVTMAVVFGG